MRPKSNLGRRKWADIQGYGNRFDPSGHFEIHELSIVMTKIVQIILLVYSLGFSTLQAKEIKIVKVIDTNLFFTSDSGLVALANLEIPSLHDSSIILRNFALDVIKYEEKAFLNKTLYAEFVSPSADSMDSTAVQQIHLFRKLPLGKLSYNKLMLENGYGTFQENQLSSYAKEYQRAAEQARKLQRGIWDLRKYNPKKFGRRDTRLRIFSVFLTEPEFFYDDWLLGFNKTFNFDVRCSRINIKPNQKPVQLGWAYEIGSVHYYLPYVKISPELRMWRYIYFETYIGTSFILPYFYYLIPFVGVNAGVMIPLSKNIRIEFERGVLGYSVFGHSIKGEAHTISYYSVGLGLKK